MSNKLKGEEFTRLLKVHKGIIYKICNSYCSDKNDREDLAQEMIYNLWKSFEHFNPVYKFSTWMYRIALNTAISFYRREKKFKNHDPVLEGLLVFEETQDDQTATEKNLRQLQHFINELKEIDRGLILLYLDDKTYKEIAEITGFTETNVSTKISRIKEKLKANFSNK